MSEFEKKVLELLKNIEKKLDNVLGAGGSAPESTKVPAEVMPATSKAEPAAKPSEAVSKQAEAPVQAVEGRRVCPKCSATDFNQIEDKSKILHSMGGIKIYAKNYQCKKCGFIL